MITAAYVSVAALIMTLKEHAGRINTQMRTVLNFMSM